MKNIKILSVIGLAVLLSLSGYISPVEAGSNKVLKFGVDADYPPWTSFEKGEFKGMEIDILKAISEKFGLKVEFVALPWETAVPALGAGKIDLLAGGMYITCERDKILDYTSPYYRENGFVVIKKGSDLNIATALCCGAKVGGNAGGTQHEWIKRLAENSKAGLKPVAYETDELALKDLVSGRLDAMVTDELVTLDYLEKYDIEIAGKIVKGYSNEIAFGIQEGDPDKLISVINNGIEWLYKSGKWQELWTKYMNINAQPMYPLPLTRITMCK
jgi:polar amino acid transport system substrate-binding protein